MWQEFNLNCYGEYKIPVYMCIKTEFSGMFFVVANQGFVIKSVSTFFDTWHSNFQRKATEVRARRSDLKKIEDLGAILEEHLILDNRYTEHSTVGLAQQWDQLDQLGMRMQHNLEQQIQARNQSGVSEDALKEFSMMFKHFDKDKSGRLNQQEFKSCLRALGYDLPMVEEGQPDPEFEAILGKVVIKYAVFTQLLIHKAQLTFSVLGITI